jgi:predicted nuclease of predicted toxin-antitoxin system
MRFLADENFPAATVRALQKAGHDVVWVMTTAPGTGDGDVVAWTAREGRILLTFDKDFGELARNAGGYPRSVAFCSFAFPCLDRATLGGRSLS